MNIEKLFDHKKVLFSLEIFPPKKDTSFNVIYNSLLKMRGLPVDFISVTYGAGGSEAQREKTCEIASLVRSTYHIEPVAHLTCVSSDKNEVQLTLDRLRENDVWNILALRGDINPAVPPKHDFTHASDLVKFIKDYDDRFNVLGACYPEGHCESPSIDADIENLKRKVDAGATHLITQLFFDNEQFYRFMDKLTAADINVPVEAGIMPIFNKNQIERTVSMCGASVPNKLATLLNRYADSPKALFDAGIFYATEQIMDLLEHDVKGIHLYTMNNVEVASRISGNIENIIAAKNGMEGC